MKIAYCLDNIYDHGGIVQITLTKANALVKLYGFNVYLVVKDNQKDSLIPLEDGVTVCDLLVYGKSKLRHWIKMRQVLNSIRPDVVVSVGLSERRLLQFMAINSNPLKIREFHFTRNYMELQAKTIMAKAHVIATKNFDSFTNFIGYDRIVVLTNEDRQLHWNGNKKVIVIPNPVTSIPLRASTCASNVVIAAGRLTEQKNYESLLKIWKAIEDKHSDWHLQIWGDGWQETLLKSKILSLGLKHSRLMGHTSNLLEKMADASVFAMTSLFEGLPLVLIEAMSVGLPVISYACPCGPKDIITDGKNGFLIPMHNEQEFAQKLLALIENENLRKEMGSNAKISSEFFNLEKIMEQWVELFNSKRR